MVLSVWRDPAHGRPQSVCRGPGVNVRQGHGVSAAVPNAALTIPAACWGNTEADRAVERAEDGKGGRRQVAVALRADGAAGARVVASGRGALAEDMLRLAFAAGIKVREDADLAEILSALEIDADMPVEAMAAVAEVLARLYALNDGSAPAALDAEESS